MALLERSQCFAQLSELLHRAMTGNGRTVLISGEAGIGKTELVEQFMSQHARAVRRLWGPAKRSLPRAPLAWL